MTDAPEIARGAAGDCCLLCGKVGINLPLDHGCKPTIDVEAYRAQLRNFRTLLSDWTPTLLDHALLYDRRAAA